MAPSHVDLSVLWVPIMPETSKLGEQMEEVGKDAAESFGKGSTGLGDKIHESVTKSKDKIKDVFHRTGSDAGKTMSDAFKEETKAVEDTAEDVGKKSGEKVKGAFRSAAGQLGKEMVSAIGPDVKRELGTRVEDLVGGAFKTAFGDTGVGKTIGEALGSAANSGVQTWVTDLQGKLGGVKDTVNSTRQAFADLTGGKTTSGVAGLADSFGKLGTVAQKFGVTVGDLPKPIQDVIGKTAELKGTAQGFADIFKELPGTIGKVGTALGELAGPLAALGATMWALKDQEKAGLFDKTDASGHEDWWKVAGGVGGSWLEDKYNRLFHGHGTPGAGPSGVDMSGTGGIGTGGDVLGSGADAYSAFSTGLPVTGPGSISSVPRNVGSDQGLTPTSSEVKKTIATLFPQVNDIGGWRPPDGYNEHSSGQALDVMIPGSGTPQGKQLGDQIRDYVMKNAKSLGVDYALWQQTQWNPDGSHSGMENRGSPTQNHMDHVHVHTVKGGGDPNAPMPSMPRGTTASGDKIPTGAQHDPLFVSAAGGSGGASSAAGGGSDSSSLAQQLGSGFMGGIAQSVGLDGSVFKTFSGASNPMDFGITKIGTGLLNWASGMMPAISGHSQTKQQQGHTYNVDQSFNLTQHGVEGNGETPYKAAMNSSNRTSALAANMPGQ